VIGECELRTDAPTTDPVEESLAYWLFFGIELALGWLGRVFIAPLGDLIAEGGDRFLSIPPGEVAMTTELAGELPGVIIPEPP